MKQRCFFALIVLSRWIGRQICKLRGNHNYFYPGDMHTNWTAHACVRCGELDRPLESLPSMPEDEFFTDPYDELPEEYVHEQFERERRWVSWLSFPKWI